jgi:hypothetical protein
VILKQGWSVEWIIVKVSSSAFIAWMPPCSGGFADCVKLPCEVLVKGLRTQSSDRSEGRGGETYRYKAASSLHLMMVLRHIINSQIEPCPPFSESKPIDFPQRSAFPPCCATDQHPEESQKKDPRPTTLPSATFALKYNDAPPSVVLGYSISCSPQPLIASNASQHVFPAGSCVPRHS